MPRMANATDRFASQSTTGFLEAFATAKSLAKRHGRTFQIQRVKFWPLGVGDRHESLFLKTQEHWIHQLAWMTCMIDCYMQWNSRVFIIVITIIICLNLATPRFKTFIFCMGLKATKLNLDKSCWLWACRILPAPSSRHIRCCDGNSCGESFNLIFDRTRKMLGPASSACAFFVELRPLEASLAVPYAVLVGVWLSFLVSYQARSSACSSHT